MTKKKKYIIFVSVLFLISVILRSYLSLFDKRMNTYNDELRYIQIAQNFFNTGSFRIYNAETDFQKILYSIVLAPFYLIKNSILRVKAISVFNSVLVSSSVFPAYLIVRKITDKKSVIVLSLIMLFMFPDMSYSMTFMSENLYLPMGLWQVYFSFRILDTENRKLKIWGSLFLGLYTYLLYLAKEVALVFILAHLFTGALTGIRKKSLKEFLPLIVYTVSFVFFFMLFKFTVFSGMGNSYNQTSLSQINSPEKIKYFMYALMYNFYFLLVSYFVFPMFLPLLKFRHTDRKNKILYVYTLAGIIFCLGVINFTISVREDLGHLSPRQHHRYYSPLFFPLMAVFLNCLFSSVKKMKSADVLLVGISLIFSVLSFFIPKTPERYVMVDSTVSKIFFNLAQNDNIRIFMIIVAVYTLTGCAVILAKKKVTAYILVFLILAGETVNYKISCDYFLKAYSITHSQQDEIYRVDNFLKKQSGNVLYIQGDWYNVKAKIADTYLTGKYNSVLLKKIDLNSLSENKVLISAYATSEYKYPCTDTEFAYAISDIPLESDDLSERINIEGVYNYYVYKVK